jgi:hypothetical protein
MLQNQLFLKISINNKANLISNLKQFISSNFLEELNLNNRNVSFKII